MAGIQIRASIRIPPWMVQDDKVATVTYGLLNNLTQLLMLRFRLGRFAFCFGESE